MNREKIISTLCGDNFSEDCSNCHGLLNLKCHQDHYCDLLNLSEQQVQYILSDINSDVYLNACPGSGKTEVVGVKCAYEMALWNKPSAGMAILTFTNSAENELRDRVSSYYRRQPDYPHFLGTFTSWLHGYLANPFLYIETGHGSKDSEDKNLQIIDPDCNSDFLNAFKTKYKYGNILNNIAANEYTFNPKENHYQYCGRLRNGKKEFQSRLNSTNYMADDIKTTKQKFWKAGFFLYEDIELLTYKLLKNHPEITFLISKRFPFIIVDECQDLSYIQLLILGKLHQYGTRLHFIGDLDQSIYAFRDIDPSDTDRFLRKYQFTEIILDKNYRSNQRIADASGALINRAISVSGMRAQSVTTPLIILPYKKDQEELMIKKYTELLASNSFKEDNCRIIVRNNSLRSRLYGHKYFEESLTPNIIEDYAHVIFLSDSNTASDFQERMQLLSRAVQKSFFSSSNHENKSKLYRPKELSESDWRKILLNVENSLLQNQEIKNLQLTWDKWKNPLKKQLASIDSPLIQNKDLKQLRLRPGIKDTIVYDTFSRSSKNSSTKSLKIETIHSCKGMSLDSVLLVSSYKKGTNEESGNYWKEWFPEYTENTVTESNRLAYVAASRAKHMLVLGIPNPTSSPLKKKDIDYLESCGFQIISCDD